MAHSTPYSIYPVKEDSQTKHCLPVKRCIAVAGRLRYQEEDRSELKQGRLVLGPVDEVLMPRSAVGGCLHDIMGG